MMSGPPAAETPILDIRHLTVTAGNRRLIENVDLALHRGERVGLIGESGSGKSLTALSTMGLLPDGLVATGAVRMPGVGDGKDLLDCDEGLLSTVRGNDLAMVFQEPMTALNPTMRVGEQVVEALRIHRACPDRRRARSATLGLLSEVRLPHPAETARSYPHQLSGGQRQRVVLALALANDPAVLICDEPTTALDVTVQALVLDLIVSGVRTRAAALLLVTHDLPVVATACERVVVMYGGRIVEAGPVHEVFTRPKHRYTQGLLAASDLEAVDEDGHLPTIAGSVPAGGHFPSGCVFRNRCNHATTVCATQPGWSGPSASAGHACYHPANTGDGGS